MRVQWTSKALSDLARLHDFLAPVDSAAAAAVVQSLTGAVGRSLDHPRIGEQVDEHRPREVRRIIVGHYELRYETRAPTIYVLRLWHTREDR